MITFHPSFRPLRYASAKDLALKAAFINKLPTQTNDVMVNPHNPVNPDSKLAASRIISNQESGLAVTLIMHFRILTGASPRHLSKIPNTFVLGILYIILAE